VQRQPGLPTVSTVPAAGLSRQRRRAKAIASSAPPALATTSPGEGWRPLFQTWLNSITVDNNAAATSSRRHDQPRNARPSGA
jgi:hypothetical protein